MSAEQLAGQMDMFALLDMPPAEDRQALLERAAMRGSGFDGGKIRIAAMLDKHQKAFDKREMYIAWLKDEYGTGGFSMDDDVFVDHDAGGLKARRFREPAFEYSYSWLDLYNVLRVLTFTGRYLSPKETETLDALRDEDGRPPVPVPRSQYPPKAVQMWWATVINRATGSLIWVEMGYDGNKLAPAMFQICGTEVQGGKTRLYLRDIYGNRTYALEDDKYFYWSAMPTQEQREGARRDWQD